jgi:hypothetical protein
MAEVKVELDSHSENESVSLTSDDENVEGSSITIPIMKCKAEVRISHLLYARPYFCLVNFK